MEVKNTMEPVAACCEAWPHISESFSWFGFEDMEFEHLRGLPSIRVDDNPWRINFCPSCGAERRNVIEIIAKEPDGQ